MVKVSKWPKTRSVFDEVAKIIQSDPIMKKEDKIIASRDVIDKTTMSFGSLDPTLSKRATLALLDQDSPSERQRHIQRRISQCPAIKNLIVSKAFDADGVLDTAWSAMITLERNHLNASLSNEAKDNAENTLPDLRTMNLGKVTADEERSDAMECTSPTPPPEVMYI